MGKSGKKQAFWAQQVFDVSDVSSRSKHKIHYTKLYDGASERQQSEQMPWQDRLFTELEAQPVVNKDYILVLNKGRVVHKIALKSSRVQYVLGRHPMADIQLESPHIGRCHAGIVFQDGSYYIKDFHSERGTYVNGQRIQADQIVRLDNASSVRIMGYEIRLQLHLDNEQTALPEKPELQDLFNQLKRNLSVSSPHLTNQSATTDSPETWRKGTNCLRVIDIVDETEQAKTFRLAGLKPMVFNYQPGQFITLVLTIEGQTIKRSYSLSSSPSRPNILEFTVKRVANGLVSNWLCDQVKLGDKLTVQGPSGKFSCFTYPASKYLFLGAGSGTTPLISMARWLLDVGMDVDVTFLTSFSSENEILFSQEFELLTTRYSNIKVGMAISSGCSNKYSWHGFNSRLDNQLLSSFVPDINDRHVFICGPESYRVEIKKMLEERGFPLANLHSESFSSGTNATSERRHCQKSATRPVEIKDAKYTVAFNKSGLSVPANEHYTLLELAEMNGIDMDYSCRTGNCAECMVKCLSGQVQMSEEAEIDSKDKQDGWVFGCCARPKSNLVIDA